VIHRCPLCTRDLSSRRLADAIIARMEIECPHCAGRLDVNVHALEKAVVLGTVALCVALASLAYAWTSQPLLLAALGAGMAGAALQYVLERTWLRRWPRYVPHVAASGLE